MLTIHSHWTEQNGVSAQDKGDQSWVLTLAHFKQMQGGHFFSEVGIASCVPSVTQMSKPTLSWLSAPGAC